MYERPPGTPNYRWEAVSSLVDKLNNGEDWLNPQRWEPVIPHDTVIIMFPGHIIKFGGGLRRDRWYYEEIKD